jgi:hypothetical protein
MKTDNAINDSTRSVTSPRSNDGRTQSPSAEKGHTPKGGQFRNNLLVSLSEYERTNAAFKTANKMRMRAKRGFWNGGKEPHDPLT